MQFSFDLVTTCYYCNFPGTSPANQNLSCWDQDELWPMRSSTAGTTELLSLSLTLNLPSCHIFLSALLSYSLFKGVVQLNFTEKNPKMLQTSYMDGSYILHIGFGLIFYFLSDINHNSPGDPRQTTSWCHRRPPCTASPTRRCFRTAGRSRSKSGSIWGGLRRRTGCQSDRTCSLGVTGTPCIKVDIGFWIWPNSVTLQPSWHMTL